MDNAADKIGRAVDADFLRSTAAALRGQLTQLADGAGVVETDEGLSLNTIATEMGIEGEFELYNTITSKVLHATGFSVLVAQAEALKTQTMDSCFLYAGSNALAILNTVNTHMNSCGLPAFE
jgi:hypothetical protein